MAGRPSNPLMMGPGPNVVPTKPATPVQVDDIREEGAWELECIYATGLGPEAFWALSSRSRTLSLALTRGTPPKVIGRAYQPEMFEVLLSHEPSLLACISRSHVQIEEVIPQARSD